MNYIVNNDLIELAKYLIDAKEVKDHLDVALDLLKIDVEINNLNNPYILSIENTIKLSDDLYQKYFTIQMLDNAIKRLKLIESKINLSVTKSQPQKWAKEMVIQNLMFDRNGIYLDVLVY